jgi:hypothetical protein
MINLIIKSISVIFSLTGLAFIFKIFGEKKAEERQQSIELKNSNENAKINKEVGDMSFDDSANFLLSQQKNRDKINQ